MKTGCEILSMPHRGFFRTAKRIVDFVRGQWVMGFYPWFWGIKEAWGSYGFGKSCNRAGAFGRKRALKGVSVFGAGVRNHGSAVEDAAHGLFAEGAAGVVELLAHVHAVHHEPGAARGEPGASEAEKVLDQLLAGNSDQPAETGDLPKPTPETGSESITT